LACAITKAPISNISADTLSVIEVIKSLNIQSGRLLKFQRKNWDGYHDQLEKHNVLYKKTEMLLREFLGLYDLVWITNGGCRKTKIVIDRIRKICTTEISPILNQLPPL